VSVWKQVTHSSRRAAAFERLTGETEPDFAATGFEQQMAETIEARSAGGRL
jgi:hypothetical protein